MEGFVKLPRDLLEWEWFEDDNMLRVYIRLLFMAQWRDKSYKGIDIKRGQLVTTIPKIMELCKLTERQTRTVLERLKTSGKVTVKTTNRFSIITLNEYDRETESDIQNVSPMADKRQTASQSNVRPTLFKEEIKELRKQETRTCVREGVSYENCSVSAYETGFERFWSSYPKKTAKQNALKAWNKLRPDEELTEKILSALERFKKTDQWQKDNGQFIPYPATWLNGRRWEDEQSSTVVTPSPNNFNNRSSSFDTNSIMESIKARYRTADST